MKRLHNTRDYVERHMWPELTGANQANISYLGGLDTSGRGRVKATYLKIAQARGKSPKTIEHQIRGLIARRIFIVREGWTFIIVGALEHNVLTCGHGACLVEATSARAEARRLSSLDELQDLRRKKDAERKQLKREELKLRRALG